MLLTLHYMYSHWSPTGAPRPKLDPRAVSSCQFASRWSRWWHSVTTGRCEWRWCPHSSPWSSSCTGACRWGTGNPGAVNPASSPRESGLSTPRGCGICIARGRPVPATLLETSQAPVRLGSWKSCWQVVRRVPITKCRSCSSSAPDSRNR